MYRFIEEKLLAWKKRPGRKPLILRGARQVGKTYAVKKFGETYYRNFVYLNFDYDEDLKELFLSSKNPRRIIEQLSLATKQNIVPGETLIFFDEVQECPEALNSLKYFCEETPEYDVIAAGSLLGVCLSDTSFPVGKVNFLDLRPMSFSEFLIADEKENLVDFMTNISKIEKIPDIFDRELNDALKTYFLIGGMPEAVLTWVETKDFSRVRQVQSEILESYESDFSKHVPKNEANKISLIWRGIPSQLARENKKFIYQAIKEGARAREYEGALNWLKDTGLAEKVYNVKSPALPLAAYEDLSAFKIYLFDIGLLSYKSGLDTKIILSKDALFREFKGALAENYCLEALRLSYRDLFYYTFDRYKVDFLAQTEGEIIPIEVKSGLGGTHTSLTRYIETFSPSLAVRFSTSNLSLDGKILNLPLYLVEYFDRLVSLVK